MSWAAMPPEVISGQIYAGAGSGPLYAAVGGIEQPGRRAGHHGDRVDRRNVDADRRLGVDGHGGGSSGGRGPDLHLLAD